MLPSDPVSHIPFNKHSPISRHSNNQKFKINSDSIQLPISPSKKRHNRSSSALKTRKKPKPDIHDKTKHADVSMSVHSPQKISSFSKSSKTGPLLSFNNFEIERMKKTKADIIIGVDEVGRGALAGPLVVCALYISPQAIKQFPEVNDSKQLDEPNREKIYSLLDASADVFFSTCERSPDNIDDSNILAMTMEAMATAVEELLIKMERHNLTCSKYHVLIDGNRIPTGLANWGDTDTGISQINRTNVTLSCEAIVKGDSKVFSIAAASIIAKVTRDRMMNALGETLPFYGFQHHKGYATQEHISAIEQFGVRGFHRLTFRPICNFLLTEKSVWPADRKKIIVDPVQRQLEAKKRRANAKSTNQSTRQATLENYFSHIK